MRNKKAFQVCKSEFEQRRSVMLGFKELVLAPKAGTGQDASGIKLLLALLIAKVGLPLLSCLEPVVCVECQGRCLARYILHFVYPIPSELCTCALLVFLPECSISSVSLSLVGMIKNGRNLARYRKVFRASSCILVELIFRRNRVEVLVGQPEAGCARWWPFHLNVIMFFEMLGSSIGRTSRIFFPRPRRNPPQIVQSCRRPSICCGVLSWGDAVRLVH